MTSRIMAAVKSKDSKAERSLRRELHQRGLRYRLHASDVPGRPDIAIRSRRIAVFVDGDFWHGNAWRTRGLPSLEAQFPNRTEWWSKKIRRNMERDAEVNEALEAQGWTVIRVWESDVLADPAGVADRVMERIRR